MRARMKVFITLALLVGTGFASSVLPTCDGTHRSALPVATPDWKSSEETDLKREPGGNFVVTAFGGLGIIEIRQDEEGAYLLGEMSPDQDVGNEDPVNPVAKPLDPLHTIYRVARTLRGELRIDNGSVEQWRRLETPVGYLNCKWRREAGPFSPGGTFYDGQRVPLKGQTTSSGPYYSPDGEHVAIVSAKGKKHEYPSLLAAGGRPPEYDGPFYVELFSVKTGKKVGRAVRIAELAGVHWVNCNWAPGGEEFVCVDFSYKRLWLIARSEFADPAVTP